MSPSLAFHELRPLLQMLAKPGSSFPHAFPTVSLPLFTKQSFCLQSHSLPVGLRKALSGPIFQKATLHTPILNPILLIHTTLFILF